MRPAGIGFANHFAMFTEEFAYAGGHADHEHDSGPLHAQDTAVLIVEDERVARRALSTLLSANGFETAAAGSAEEALALLNLNDHPAPRIALVDFNLPGMSGLDFIRRLGRLNPAVTAVLMTGAGEDTLAAALDEHRQPVPCLRKPLDFRTLLAMIGEDQP